MEKVITEVIIGVIILSLLLIVIPIYRESNDLVRNVAYTEDYSEKVKIEFDKVTEDCISGEEDE